MTAIDYEREYVHLVDSVGRVLNDLEAMRDATGDMVLHFREVRNWKAVDRCTVRALALQDAVDLWEGTKCV